MDFYNEWDKDAAQWLRNLIAAKLIPPGVVDTRDIREIQSGELRQYRRVHLFAGIGGWPLALKMAGWPDDRPAWTGSCPCQPFSCAGKRKGASDDRHLWPDFLRLIAKHRPPTVFGEQVASKDGRLWLDGVRLDLEALGYAVGAADLCAAGVGAPHIRQRLYWVAESEDVGRERQQASRGRRAGASHGRRLGDPHHHGPQGRDERRHGADERALGATSLACGLALPTGEQAHAADPGGLHAEPRCGSPNSFWAAFDLIPCGDGKARRLEPGLSPLAHGVSGRVGKLRAYGNAIVPQVAAEFIKAYLETERE